MRGYLQSDKLWAEVTLGQSGKTMRSNGCLVCCLAEYFTRCSIECSPYALCIQLNSVDGFDTRGQLIWSKLHMLFPALQLSGNQFSIVKAENTEHYMLIRDNTYYDPRTGEWQKIDYIPAARRVAGLTYGAA